MKNLTVQQKNYLIKRIDAISNSKLQKIEEEYHGRIKFNTGSSSNLDLAAAKAVLAGTVRLATATELLAIIAKRVKEHEKCLEEAKIARAANRHYGYRSNNISLYTFDFVSKPDVKKYHEISNAAAKKLDDKKKSRRKKVISEAAKIKDKVMFEGSTEAVALLDKFANKEF